MRIRTIGIFLLALAPAVAPAQNADKPFHGMGYVFYGPGRASDGDTVQHFGGGGEGFLYKGLAAGAEVGYMFPRTYFVDGVGLLSVNGAYHFNRNRRAKVSPFVTSGYSLAFRSGHENLYNFGGGVTWWPTDHVGLRFEFRDYVWPGYELEHTPEARISFSFR